MQGDAMIYLVGEILAVIIFLCLPPSVYQSGRRAAR
jgi:hypothetical protein